MFMMNGAPSFAPNPRPATAPAVQRSSEAQRGVSARQLGIGQSDPAHPSEDENVKGSEDEHETRKQPLCCAWSEFFGVESMLIHTRNSFHAGARPILHLGYEHRRIPKQSRGTRAVTSLLAPCIKPVNLWEFSNEIWLQKKRGIKKSPPKTTENGAGVGADCSDPL